MAELTSVGLDVGTTTTQLIVSRLTAENRASGFAVPEMEITAREIRYRSPVHMTPLRSGTLIDAEALAQLVSREYAQAGITREQVDTGAVIITGESSRKENAAAALSALSHMAGEFVVATAGPELESLLAAQGAGAVAYSAKTGKRVLHIDIGGGTSNLAWIEDGKVLRAGCLNVGGRLLKFRPDGILSYVSPVLEGLFPYRPGEAVPEAAVQELARTLTAALEMAAGLRPATELLHRLTTREVRTPWQIPQGPLTISFSGGVADCIQTRHPPLAFGDLGPVLGRCIRQSRLCAGAYRLGEETIRATVIGAGCHSTRLSGSTVFFRNIAFPMQNLPVISLSGQEQSLASAIVRAIESAEDGPVVLAMPGLPAPSYTEVRSLAQEIAAGFQTRPVLLCLEADMAKALGHALALLLPAAQPILCIDRIRLPAGSFLDVGAPVGPALPVVVKTLIFE